MATLCEGTVAGEYDGAVVTAPAAAHVEEAVKVGDWWMAVMLFPVAGTEKTKECTSQF